MNNDDRQRRFVCLSLRLRTIGEENEKTTGNTLFRCDSRRENRRSTRARDAQGIHSS